MKLVRYAYFDDRVLGVLSHDGTEYYTIEKPCKENKPYVSCIPEGEYTLTRVDSPKFGANMWEVSAVPDRTHILVHVANYSRDVVGCIGLGQGVFANLGGVSSSRAAVQQFYEQTEGIGQMSLTIEKGAWDG